MDEKEIKDYLDFVESHKKYYSNSRVKYILDRNELITFESPDGRQLGVKHRGPYSNMVIDLIQDERGNRLAFERIIPENDGAVVIVTKIDHKYLLLKQYRHLIGEIQISFPRGCGEKGLSPENNAKKELSEEVGYHDAKLTFLGTISPDSGVTSCIVYAYSCQVDEYKIEPGYEDIEGSIILDGVEIDRMIAEGMINDAISISAYTMDRLRQY